MIRALFRVVVALATLAAPCAASGQSRLDQPVTGGQACDRRACSKCCSSTEALTDNNVSRLAVSSGLRVTNNGSVTTLGKGDVWGPARRLPYRQTFVDPVTGAAVFYGVVTT